ncbi:MAG TPA: aminomethyl-transferring glycine dehydrogenase subunit GcvPA [Candidatus Dormibacteraeota bacterium]|nr:aminomethyl-transferring glycine dehydrogenase subunit GcvPA [Candidatus Dormibacteraeota bacterium]
MAYLPNSDSDRAEMLSALGLNSVGELFRDVPAGLRDPDLELPPPLSELELIGEMRRLAGRNRPLSEWDCFLGAGVYSRFIPAIVRATIGRPEFYTAYTPYQAEASQGYLQSIFEFQSMVAELFDLDVANASMYDVATATAEGALLATLHTGRPRVLVASTLHPEVLAVLETYLSGRGAELVRLSARDGVTDLAGVQRALAAGDPAVLVVPQPNFLGLLEPVGDLVELAHAAGALALVVADPIAAAAVEPPGALGADLVAADGQQLGIPPQLGGPTLGLLACRDELVRRIPGRLVGLTTDSRGGRAFCLTLQTREQHIRRERATSNICTNHALMALAATAYLAKMGAGGLRGVADISYRRSHHLADRLAQVPGFSLKFPQGDFLWEFVLETPVEAEPLARELAEEGILAGYPLGGVDPDLSRCLLVCTTELTSPAAMDRLVTRLTRVAAPSLPAGVSG